MFFPSNISYFLDMSENIEYINKATRSMVDNDNNRILNVDSGWWAKLQFKEVYGKIDVYTDKFWLIYSNLISIFLIVMFIFILGIFFFNNAQHVKILNLFSAYYLTVFLYFTSLNFNYKFDDLNLSFNQNTTLFVNLFVLIATLTVLIFFLGISNLFFLEENSKIEFSLLIWFIYVSAIFLISTTDFISVIILLECIAFSSYVLVGFERRNKFSTTSALKYLLIAAIPSGFFMLGLILIYSNYGSFSQDYLNLVLTSVSNIGDADFYQNAWVYTTLFYTTSGLFDQYNLHLHVNNDIYTSLEADFVEYLRVLNLVLMCNPPGEVLHHLKLAERQFIHPEEAPCSSCEGGRVSDAYLYLNVRIISTQYLFVINELFLFNTLFDLFFNSIGFDNAGAFDKTPTFPETPFQKYRFLADHKLFGITDWFSALSWCEMLRELAVEGEEKSVMKYISFATFGIPEAQTWTARVWSNENHIASGWGLYIHKILSLAVENARLNFLDSFEIRYLSHTFELVKKYAVSGQNIQDFIYQINGVTNFTFVPIVDVIGFINETSLSYPYLDITTYSLYYTKTFLVIYLVLIFILVNLCFKVTAAPFHTWAPSVYGGSPLATLTFLSIFSKLTIIFFMIWIFLNILDSLKNIWQPIMLTIAFLSVFFSILGAFSEKNFKRFFVYSSMGHVGFMLLGIAILNLDGMRGSIDYLILYLLSSLIVWFIIMHLTKKTITLVSLKGLYANHPLLSGIFAITIFSLSGIPPLGGFFVKYEIFSSIINSSLFYLAYILLICTVVSFFYYLRLIKIIYFENNDTIQKYRNLDDVKLRLISIGSFFIPLYMLFVENSFGYILNEILLKSLA